MATGNRNDGWHWKFEELAWICIILGLFSVSKIGTFFYFNPFQTGDQGHDEPETDEIMERLKRFLAIYWLVVAVMSWIMIYLFIEAVKCVRVRQLVGTNEEAEQKAKKAVERCVKWDKACLIIFGIEFLLNYLVGHEFTTGVSFILMLVLFLILVIPKLNKLEKGVGNGPVQTEENEV